MYIKYLIFGGLGNQIFQVNEAYCLSKLFGTPVRIDYSRIDKRDNHFKFWMKEVSSIPEIEFSSSQIIDLECEIGIDVSDEQNLKLSKLNRNYFFGWSPSSRKLLEVGLFRTGSFMFELENIEKKQNNYAAIHIRRGDYRDNPQLGIINDSYYLKVLRKFKSEQVDTIVLFSDEYDYACNFIERYTKLDFQFIVHRDSNAISALRELSKFPNLIASNSTFSFWGSFFGRANTFIPFPFYASNAFFGHKLYRSMDSINHVWDAENFRRNMKFSTVRWLAKSKNFIKL